MHRNDRIRGHNTLERTNEALIKCMHIQKTYKKEEFDWSLN